MTKPERLLAAVGVSIVAGAILLVAYVRQANPADAQATGCLTARARLGQVLDQVRFSTSAAHEVSVALEDTARTRRDYAAMIAVMRRGLGRDAHRHAGAAEASAERDLAQADGILRGQDEALARAQVQLNAQHRELASAAPVVREASRDLRDEDCSALALTLARSGWPKDRLLGDLAEVARLNAAVSDRLDAALSLIVQARSETRPSALTGRTSLTARPPG